MMCCFTRLSGNLNYLKQVFLSLTNPCFDSNFYFTLHYRHVHLEKMCNTWGRHIAGNRTFIYLCENAFFNGTKDSTRLFQSMRDEVGLDGSWTRPVSTKGLNCDHTWVCGRQKYNLLNNTNRHFPVYFFSLFGLGLSMYVFMKSQWWWTTPVFMSPQNFFSKKIEYKLFWIEQFQNNQTKKYQLTSRGTSQRKWIIFAFYGGIADTQDTNVGCLSEFSHVLQTHTVQWVGDSSCRWVPGFTLSIWTQCVDYKCKKNFWLYLYFALLWWGAHTFTCRF